MVIDQSERSITMVCLLVIIIPIINYANHIKNILTLWITHKYLWHILSQLFQSQYCHPGGGQLPKIMLENVFYNFTPWNENFFCRKIWKKYINFKTFSFSRLTFTYLLGLFLADFNRILAFLGYYTPKNAVRMDRVTCIKTPWIPRKLSQAWESSCIRGWHNFHTIYTLWFTLF